MPRHGQRKKRGGNKQAGRNKKTARSKQTQSQQSGTTAGEERIPLNLTATLFEDAHVGSGAGGAGIDALVARDRDGRPVIWASHLKGLLRDAARRVRGADLANDLFGRGGGQRQRVLLTSLYATSAPASRIWRSTARASFENRAPRDDTLRVVEYVPKGTIFKGSVELRKEDKEAFERLVAEIDAVGQGRATGAGRVRIELSEATIDSRSAGRPTDRLRLLLRNLDPLCITATSTPDNLVPSMSFVPGRSVLGALAGWLIAEGNREAAALLTNARLSVSDALPLPEEFGNGDLREMEVLPAPLALQREKAAGSVGPIPWWAQPSESSPRLDMWRHESENAKLKRPEPDLFVYRQNKNAAWQVYRPLTRVRLRNGRANPDQVEPDLFAVEQIAERTVFLCEISGAPKLLKKLARALAPVLEGRRWLRVGRGGVPTEIARATWKKPSPLSTSHLEHAYLILTSDLLVRDQRLRWVGAMSTSRFQELEDWPSDVTVTRELQESVSVYGFNGTARLRRLPALAVRRGSIYEVEGTGVAQLIELAARGRWLGERTHEGFGRFMLYPIDSLPGTGGASTKPVSPSTDDPSEAIAERTRRWFDAHRNLSRVEKKDGRGQRPPSLSQWNDLVADLQRRRSAALDERQNPTTLGGRSWKHGDAKAILDSLGELPSSQRVDHARMFVLWLRAEMKDNGNRENGRAKS